MDVIILAAGENVRLQAAGLAPGLKPLLVVDGEVLIRRLCRQARALSNGDITIVCSPTNVPEIIFATKDYASHYVVQPEPVGPCDAVDRAIKLGISDDVMLLMGDNYISEMPPIHNGFTPVVCTTNTRNTASQDEALHPISHDGRFESDLRPSETWHRWLGPLTFPKRLWNTGERDWEHALSRVQFCVWDIVGVQDMGVLR